MHLYAFLYCSHGPFLQELPRSSPLVVGVGGSKVLECAGEEKSGNEHRTEAWVPIHLESELRLLVGGLEKACSKSFSKLAASQVDSHQGALGSLKHRLHEGEATGTAC